MNITNCKKLVTLGAEFGWNIHSNTEIDILFTIRPPAKWIAWGVNPGPQRAEMVGTRAVIGISQPNGTLVVRKYNIISDTKLGCRLKPSQDFDDVIVKNMKGEVKPRRYMSIFATLILPPDQAAYNILKLNHVWQVGFEADDALMEPKMHSTSLQNVDSTETINMTTGRGLSIGHRQHHLRTVHGILNIVGWGTMLIPFSMSKVMLALRLTPTKTDDYRKYWNMYHHFLGYSLLAVISVNIFQGIAILKPNKTWLWVYVGVLGMLGLVAIGLEIFTWTKFIYDLYRGKKSRLEFHDGANRSN
nr:cytochrome b561 and DOMON domain-containing protein At4g12980-like [Malus domestica]